MIPLIWFDPGSPGIQVETELGWTLTLRFDQTGLDQNICSAEWKQFDTGAVDTSDEVANNL